MSVKELGEREIKPSRNTKRNKGTKKQKKNEKTEKRKRDERKNESEKESEGNATELNCTDTKLNEAERHETTRKLHGYERKYD